MCIMVDKSTRVLVQGITGAAGSFHARKMIQYGTQVVAGVSPGHGGEKLERVPIFDTVERAVSATGANASVVFVPPPFATDALLEAAGAELPLVICISDGIGASDLAKAKSVFSSTSTRLLGPNCHGVISPGGRCKIGVMPGHIHRPGRIGIVSRCSALTDQAVSQLTRLGLGQSTVVGIGTAPITGTTFIDVLKMFDADSETDAVLMIGGPSGRAEEEAAEFVAHGYAKPVAGFIAPPPMARLMSLLPARWLDSGEALGARGKIDAMKAAGIVMARSLSELGIALEQARRLSRPGPH
jgi:succinyl-CoA synthetase alpha subunit